MTKLEELFKKAEDHAAKVNQTRNDILFMQKRLEEKKKAAEDLANAGDEEAYVSIMHDISDLESRLYVKNKIVNSTDPAISSEEMQEAWDEYAAAYNKKHLSKYRAFEKQRQQLCKLYAEMMSDQAELLKVRKKAGEYTGAGKKYGFVTRDELWKFEFDELPGSHEHVYQGIASGAPSVNLCGRETNDLLAAYLYDVGAIDADTFINWYDTFICNAE